MVKGDHYIQDFTSVLFSEFFFLGEVKDKFINHFLHLRAHTGVTAKSQKCSKSIEPDKTDLPPWYQVGDSYRQKKKKNASEASCISRVLINRSC